MMSEKKNEDVFLSLIHEYIGRIYTWSKTAECKHIFKKMVRGRYVGRSAAAEVGPSSLTEKNSRRQAV